MRCQIPSHSLRGCVEEGDGHEGGGAVEPSLSKEAMKAMQVAELKSALRERGLDARGRKGVLLQRLIQAATIIN